MKERFDKVVVNLVENRVDVRVNKVMNELNTRIALDIEVKLQNQVETLTRSLSKDVLELEKRTDAKFIDTKQNTAKAIIEAWDVSNFRKELEGFVESRIDQFESDYDANDGTRIDTLEKKIKDMNLRL